MLLTFKTAITITAQLGEHLVFRYVCHFPKVAAVT